MIDNTTTTAPTQTYNIKQEVCPNCGGAKMIKKINWGIITTIFIICIMFLITWVLAIQISIPMLNTEYVSFSCSNKWNNCDCYTRPEWEAKYNICEKTLPIILNITDKIQKQQYPELPKSGSIVREI